MHVSVVESEVKIYQWLRERLVEAFPDADDETIRDSLEGISNLPELIASLIRSALLDEAMQLGLRARQEEMRARLGRLEARSAKKRELALYAMDEAGLKRLEQPDFTASLRAGTPSVVVMAESEIPADYWLPQAPKLDRQSLLAGLKRGAAIPGASLSNPKPNLNVRTK